MRTALLLLLAGTLLHGRDATYVKPQTELLTVFDGPISIQWSSLPPSVDPSALLDKDGFRLWNSEHKEILFLARDKRGDEIYETLVTLLVRSIFRNWELKDWRDWDYNPEHWK